MTMTGLELTTRSVVGSMLSCEEVVVSAEVDMSKTFSGIKDIGAANVLPG
jgi:hypothetical protein